MNIHTEKTGQLKSKPVATELSQKGSNGTGVQFTDNRPEAVAQRKLQDLMNSSSEEKQPATIQRKNNTGLPDNLKSGVESLSGISMDDVKVHYNSDQPKQLQAHAFAQGTNIHIAAGQEKHLPHEAWHVVQQKQGRVKPTLQMKGVAVNDNEALETEANVMGSHALQMKRGITPLNYSSGKGGSAIYQRVPVEANGHWEDTAVDANQFNTLSELFTANAATYHGYTDAQLLPILKIVREHLTAAQLSLIMGPATATRVSAIRTQLNLNTIRVFGVEQATINEDVARANEILGAFNIHVVISHAATITQQQLGAGGLGLDGRGRLDQHADGQEIWNLMGTMAHGNDLSVIWVPDFTGYGWLGKPNAITKTFELAAVKRSMIFMRPGQGGQTLAHEAGHAMGKTDGAIDHGEHVDAFEFNLMHSDPLIQRLYTNLRTQQIAAFKGSKHVTERP